MCVCVCLYIYIFWKLVYATMIVHVGDVGWFIIFFQVFFCVTFGLIHSMYGFYTIYFINEFMDFFILFFQNSWVEMLQPSKG